MNKKIRAFSIFEVLVMIVVLSILVTVAISKFGSTANRTAFVRLKADVLHIQTEIALYASKQVLLHNTMNYPLLLDNCSAFSTNCILFNGTNEYKLLKQPIYSCSETAIKPMCWMKAASTRYLFWIDNNTHIEFTYSPLTGAFACNPSEILCKELEL